MCTSDHPRSLDVYQRSHYIARCVPAILPIAMCASDLPIAICVSPITDHRCLQCCTLAQAWLQCAPWAPPVGLNAIGVLTGLTMYTSSIGSANPCADGVMIGIAVVLRLVFWMALMSPLLSSAPQDVCTKCLIVGCLRTFAITSLKCSVNGMSHNQCCRVTHDPNDNEACAPQGQDPAEAVGQHAIGGAEACDMCWRGCIKGGGQQLLAVISVTVRPSPPVRWSFPLTWFDVHWISWQTGLLWL